MIQLPALILSLVIASALGLIFFAWRGRNARDLVFFWLASIAGFAAGQIAGELLELVPWTIGEVHVVEATLLAVLFLAIASWLRLEDQKQ
jgi:uncharacterized membrane-anchored protein